MANFFNDLNKLVNTIDKVDRMLTQKPKRPRTKYITKRFTEDEIDTLLMALECFYDNESQNDSDGYCKKIKKLQIKFRSSDELSGTV